MDTEEPVEEPVVRQYFSQLTPHGKAVSRDVFNGGETVKLSHMAVGYGAEDTGNGYYIPADDQPDLLNEWYRFELNSLTVDPNNPAWLIAEGIIREDIGGHWIHEVSVIDNNGGVVGIATYPETYKPTVPQGTSSAAVVRVILQVDDANKFQLVIDTSLALVTRDEFAGVIANINSKLNALAPIHNPALTGIPTAPTQPQDGEENGGEETETGEETDGEGELETGEEIAGESELETGEEIDGEGDGESDGNEGPQTPTHSAPIATTEYVRAAASGISKWVTDNFAPIGSGGGGGGQPPAPGTGAIMGARWFKNASPTTLTRLYDAVGLNFTPAVNGVGGNSDFDAMPIYQDIRLCNVINGGEVTAYYGEPGFSRTPSSGDVMVEIPRFYFKIVENLDTRDYLISDVKHDNTWQESPRHAPTATKPNGYDRIYVSAYTLNANYKSQAGNASAVNMTRAAARTGCANRGSQYWQYDYATYCTLQLLYLVEVADWNSQAAVGMGNVSTSAQINTGNTDNILFHSGSTANAGAGTGTVKYRNIENLWGNIYQWVDGININERVAHISLIPSQYVDDTANNYSALSYTNANANSEFIKQLGFDVNYPWAQMCTAGGGADGTFIPDKYFTSTGWRVLSVGGGWNGGGGAGLFCFHASSASSSVSTSVGCRLLCLPD